MKKKCLLLLATCICLFAFISFFSCEKDCQHCDADYDGLCDHCSESYMPDGEWSTVSFIVNGGDAIATQRLRHGASLPNAVRAGYTFGGWFTDTALCSSIAEVPSDNLTVYAYWSEENKPGDFVFEGEETLTVTDYTANDESVHVPAYIGGVAVDAISAEAFAGNKQITAVGISANVSYLAPGAFSWCENLAVLTVEEGNGVYYSVDNCIVETATQTLLFGCKTSVIQADGTVVAIGEAAFEGCAGLQALTLPASIVKIGERAFSGCAALATITVESDNETYHSEGNCLIETATGKLILGCKNSVIPTDGSVTVIGEYAFAGCTALTAITLPSGLTAVEAGAFYGCTALLGISIPTTVSSIGHEAFSGCTALALVEFSPGTMLTSIQNYAFADCTALTSITVPSSVTAIGFAAFARCSRLASITLPFAGSGTTVAGRTHFGYIFGANTFEENAAVVPATLTSVMLTGAAFIGNHAFNGCVGLLQIVLPDTLTAIDGNAFYGCLGLTSVVIPWRVSSIDRSAFLACTNLAELTVHSDNGVYTSVGNAIIKKDTKTLVIGCKASVIPTDGSVTAIGPYAFYGCTALESIRVPAAVTAIGDNAFRGCTALLAITVESGNTVYKSVGNCLIEAATGTLILGCQGSVIPTDGSITAIGAYAFEGCTALTSVSIPAGVTEIGDFAFAGCSNLASIAIPATVRLIGNEAFSACAALLEASFARTDGWWCATILYASGGIALSPADLANGLTAAAYLKDTYCAFYWRCGGAM